MDFTERITIDPDICHGKPCIRGLRYPVEMILELLSSGMTTNETLADYKDLEEEDILAALSFATRLSRVKRIELASALSFSLTHRASASFGLAAQRVRARSDSYAGFTTWESHDKQLDKRAVAPRALRCCHQRF